VPTVVLCAALVADAPLRSGRVMRRCVGLAVVSCAISTVGWVFTSLSGAEPPTEIYTGEAIADVSEPGDTIVVFGGRADIVFASGLRSPYEHLWSLPMRTNDPDLSELTALLRSEDAPTWFVGWVAFDAWNGTGDAELETTLEEGYLPAGEACGEHPIWVRRDAPRDRPLVDCDHPWGFRLGFSVADRPR
jgi:hypothetical protein